MFDKRATIEDEKYTELNNAFEEKLNDLAVLLKEIHDKIIAGEISTRNDLITAYEKKINVMAGKFPDANHERVKPYFDRFNEILNKFGEYREKGGNI